MTKNRRETRSMKKEPAMHETKKATIRPVDEISATWLKIMSLVDLPQNDEKIECVKNLRIEVQIFG